MVALIVVQTKATKMSPSTVPNVSSDSVKPHHAPHQVDAGHSFERVAGAACHRDGHWTTDQQVRDARADENSRPEPRAEDQQRGEGDAGGRPYECGESRHRIEHQAELRGDDVCGGQNRNRDRVLQARAHDTKRARLARLARYETIGRVGLGSRRLTHLRVPRLQSVRLDLAASTRTCCSRAARPEATATTRANRESSQSEAGSANRRRRPCRS